LVVLAFGAPGVLLVISRSIRIIADVNKNMTAMDQMMQMRR
jgi:hypothetical protein